MCIRDRLCSARACGRLTGGQGHPQRVCVFHDNRRHGGVKARYQEVAVVVEIVKYVLQIRAESLVVEHAPMDE